MARCLVIGANGFIGSHLTDRLVEAGHAVTAFDRFSAGLTTFESDRVKIAVGDFLNRSDLLAALRGQQYVFHFLSTTTPATAESDPTLDIRTNVAQTVELLELSVEANVERFYFASTGGAIYGDQGRDDYSELDPTFPVSPYGIGKLTIENYLRYFKAKHDLQSVSLRISNPYGTRQHPNKKQGLIPIVLRQVERGLPIVRYGDGSMVRDYIFVEDLAQMIVRMVARGARHHTYNLGSGRGETVTAILDAIARVTGRKLFIEERAIPPTFVDRVVLNTRRYVDEFGPQVYLALDEGIAEIWDEMRK